MENKNQANVAYMQRQSDGSAKQVDVQVSLADYQAASKLGMSFSQYLDAKFGDADERYGTAWAQMCESVGVLMTKDGATPIGKPSVNQILNGAQVQMASGFGAVMSTGTINAPKGGDTSIAGRLFYPEIIMETIRSGLSRDNSDVDNAFNSMIAVTDNIYGAHYIQPIINVTAPEAKEHRPIAQGAEPSALVSISASQITRSIPTVAIGLEITDQAANFASLDLVTIILAAQTRGEKIRMIERDISAFINGDVDANVTALTKVKLQTFDAAITADGEVTHKAALKMLHNNYQKRAISHGIMDLDTFLAFEGRAGRPIVVDDTAKDNRLTYQMTAMNFGIQHVQSLILDTSLIGADTAVFLDSRFALRRVVDVSASYEAVENFVMKRITQMRFDYGQHITRIYDEAFDAVDLTVA